MAWGGKTRLLAAGVLGAAVPLACGAAEEKIRTEIVEYATGEWTCEMVTPESFGIVAMGALATVTADDADSGEIRFRVTTDGSDLTPEHTGTWQLDGTDLQVEMPAQMTRYAMDGVDLATDLVEIHEDADGAALQQVEVDRDGDAVLFAWADPWTGDGWSMNCAKA